MDIEGCEAQQYFVQETRPFWASWIATAFPGAFTNPATGKDSLVDRSSNRLLQAIVVVLRTPKISSSSIS